MAKRILLVGGGTGGHVFPLVAVAESLLDQKRMFGFEVEMLMMGSGGLIKKEAAVLNIKCRRLLSTKWRRYFSLANFLDLLKTPIAFIQSLFWVWLFMPDIIFAKGGFGSLWPLVAARILFIPYVIHESDAVPGAVNSFFSAGAKKIFLAYDIARNFFPNKEVHVVGVPMKGVMKKIVENPPKRIEALNAFGFKKDLPVVLISGGSQGAAPLNEVILLALIELTQKFQVIHQTGEVSFSNTKKGVEQIISEQKNGLGQIISQNYSIVSFLDSAQLVLAYLAADVIVCRSGSQIFEIAALGKPTIVVPLPNASRDHQMANAKEFAKYGAILIEQPNLTPHILMNQIDEAYQNRETLSSKIKNFTPLNAADIIAKYLIREEII